MPNEDIEFKLRNRNMLHRISGKVLAGFAARFERVLPVAIFEVESKNHDLLSRAPR